MYGALVTPYREPAGKNIIVRPAVQVIRRALQRLESVRRHGPVVRNGPPAGGYRGIHAPVHLQAAVEGLLLQVGQQESQYADVLRRVGPRFIGRVSGARKG